MLTNTVLVDNSKSEVPRTSENVDFPCRFCSRTFQTILGLGVHMRVHSEAKSFFCNICFKTYMHEQSLDRHKEKEHQNTSHLFENESGRRKQTHSCSICGLIFQTKLTMRFHKRTHDGM